MFSHGNKVKSQSRHLERSAKSLKLNLFDSIRTLIPKIQMKTKVVQRRWITKSSDISEYPQFTDLSCFWIKTKSKVLCSLIISKGFVKFPSYTQWFVIFHHARRQRVDFRWFSLSSVIWHNTSWSSRTPCGLLPHSLTSSWTLSLLQCQPRSRIARWWSPRG